MTYPPEVEGGAAARCAVGLVRGLDAAGVECRVLTAAPVDQQVDVPSGMSVEIVRVAHPSRMRARAYRLLSPGLPFVRAELVARLRERAAESDVVHFFDAAAATAVRSTACPSLVQVHFLTLRDRGIGLLPDRRNRETLERLRVERRAVRRARWLLANSPEVAQPLASSAPRAEVAVAPLALDGAHYPCPAELAAPLAGLIGTARWPPTRSAVERVLAGVWPRVLARRPDARLLLAGAGMEREAFAHLPELPGVEWCGTVPSASGFLRSLGLLLYPLPAGSGTKIKVLESLALGVPVVTTPDGAEGLCERDGVSVESDDERIAAAAWELLADAGRRRAAGAAGLKNFERNHTPLAAARPVVRLYERMLA